MAVDNRESKDQRSFGELFMVMCKEIEDISFVKALEFLLATFIEFANDYLCLPKAAVSKMVDIFIAGLPCVYADWSSGSRCES